MTDPNATANGGNNAPAEAPRGMPYYEKLRRDLREALQKKRAIDAGLAQIEDNILVRETAYLEETSAGNIIKGFDNYIKGTTTSAASGGAGTTTRRKAVISDADRIFSRSSSNFVKDASTPASSQTPSLAPTPTSTAFASRENSHGAQGARSGVGKNKKKALDDDDGSDGKPAKRGKISYGRD